MSFKSILVSTLTDADQFTELRKYVMACDTKEQCACFNFIVELCKNTPDYYIVDLLNAFNSPATTIYQGPLDTFVIKMCMERPSIIESISMSWNQMETLFRNVRTGIIMNEISDEKLDQLIDGFIENVDNFGDRVHGHEGRLYTEYLFKLLILTDNIEKLNEVEVETVETLYYILYDDIKLIEVKKFKKMIQNAEQLFTKQYFMVLKFLTHLIDADTKQLEQYSESIINEYSLQIKTGINLKADHALNICVTFCNDPRFETVCYDIISEWRSIQKNKCFLEVCKNKKLLNPIIN